MEKRNWKAEIRKVKVENGEEKIPTLPDMVPDQVGAGGVNANLGWGSRCVHCTYEDAFGLRSGMSARRRGSRK